VLKLVVACVGVQKAEEEAGEEGVAYERKDSDTFVGVELEDENSSAVDDGGTTVVLEEDSQPIWQVRDLADWILAWCSEACERVRVCHMANSSGLVFGRATTSEARGPTSLPS
jgi:hypothetical protein